jgi:hypothetical protein
MELRPASRSEAGLFLSGGRYTVCARGLVSAAITALIATGKSTPSTRSSGVLRRSDKTDALGRHLADVDDCRWEVVRYIPGIGASEREWRLGSDWASLSASLAKRFVFPATSPCPPLGIEPLPRANSSCKCHHRLGFRCPTPLYQTHHVPKSPFPIHDKPHLS